LRVYP